MAKKYILHCYNCSLETESEGPEKDFQCPRCKNIRIVFVKVIK